jgi:hypothetical protein
MQPRRLPVWVPLTLLALGTVAIRLPFLTPRLAHWDAVNYALGLHDFNVAAHQPHPPGSPYFILLGRAALGLVGDDNATLILVSLVASVGAVLGEYALGRSMVGKRGGFLAALVLMTQPVFWGYGTMGMPWTLLACLAVTVGLTCQLMMSGQRWLVLPSALLVGIASGFRLEVTVFLFPLWAWAVHTVEPSPRRRLVAYAVVPACVLVWLVPVAASSGGLTPWSERMLAMFVPTDASPGPIARQLASNTAISFGTLAFTLGPAVALSLVCDRHAALRWTRTTLRSRSAIFWLLWILPSFVFLWLFDSTEPGHALVFAVALVALGTGLIVASARTVRRLILCGTLLVGTQALLFVFASPQSERPLAWTANSMLLNVTAPGLRTQQDSLADALQIIRSQFAPGETAILTVTGQDPYRFMMYYLPEYVVLRLDPVTQTVLTAGGRHQGTWQLASDCLFEGGGVRHAVWVLAARSEPGIVPDGAGRVSSPGNAGPFQVWELRPGPQTPEYLGFTIGGACTQAIGPPGR